MKIRSCMSASMSLLLATVCGFVILTSTACQHTDFPTAVPADGVHGTASKDASPGDRGRRADELTVMTYNIYQGTELQNSLAATTAQEFVIGAAQDFAMMQQTNFRERARAIAAEIQAADPDLVGMQEVALWRTGVTQFPSVPALTVEQDFLQILLDALAASGDPYTVVSSVQNLDVGGPALFPTGFMDVRLTDRNVILAKGDGAIARLGLSNAQSGNYTTNLVVPTVGGPVQVLEGWASVDVRLAGRTARLITTNLDAFVPAIRLAQASELLGTIANTDLPVIVVGDLNSTTSATSYSALTSAGFVDAWSSAHPDADGFTCCQVLPTITNDTPSLSERIDYVLTRGPFEAREIEEVGSTVASRTPTGLWPSDHAGLVARLRLPPMLASVPAAAAPQ